MVFMVSSMMSRARILCRLGGRWGVPGGLCLLLSACGADSQAVFGDGPNDCTLTGTWATYVEVGVGWESATILAGAGTTRQWILSHRRSDASGTVDTARACGIGAKSVPIGSPWFHTIAVAMLFDSEWTGVTFSPALFDSGLLPEVILPINIRSASSTHLARGDQFTTQPVPFQFGVNGLGTDAAWPNAADIVPFLADHDADGHPGLTGSPFEGAVPGENPPVNFLFPRLNLDKDPPRASALYMAIRTRSALGGALTSCSPPRFDGSADPATLQIDVRSVACTVAGSGDCDATESAFIDTNLPVFKPNGTSRVVSIKVPDRTTCAQVRAMKF
jgi:hypothetical protein